MSDVVISVENLGKKYVIGHQQPERYVALRDVIANSAKGLVKSLQGGKSQAVNPTLEEFWALKDVSFEVKQGDRVGIIGRNGAGKSTLLKILSRITDPTEGRIKIRGRVASLLEVGTGFHPELTGRENILLNGSILGMSRVEIHRKFDEIVAFAEVERFLDTPVKRYSSGMYVRLAFAVAAHLEPEILIVDEVLAVGDTQFQKKCLGKMEDVGKEGRTVLFVSHDIAAVQGLCSSVMYLKSGEMRSFGQVEENIELYLNEYQVNNSSQYPIKIGNFLKLVNFQLNPSGITSGESVNFTIEFSTDRTTVIKDIAILIYSILGTRIAMIDLRKENIIYKVSDSETTTITGKIAKIPLIEGDYMVGLYIASADCWLTIMNLVNLAVGYKQTQSTDIIPYASKERGFVEIEAEDIVLS
jgi:lipopolysaccharide transport system ATP-binding protein